MRDGIPEINTVWDMVFASYPDLEILAKARLIMDAKNRDYAGVTDASSFFANFLISASLCFVTPELPILNHISTKVARLSGLYGWNIGEPKKEPTNESLEDTYLDGINYTIILWGYFVNQFNNYHQGNDKYFRSLLHAHHSIGTESYFIDWMEEMVNPIPDIMYKFWSVTMAMDSFRHWDEDSIRKLVSPTRELLDEFVRLYRDHNV